MAEGAAEGLTLQAAAKRAGVTYDHLAVARTKARGGNETFAPLLALDQLRFSTRSGHPCRGSARTAPERSGRLNITVPTDLARTIARHRDSGMPINISAICAEAIARALEVDGYLTTDARLADLEARVASLERPGVRPLWPTGAEERERIRAALDATATRAEAAEVLGVSERVLYRRMREHGISRRRQPAAEAAQED